MQRPLQASESLQQSSDNSGEQPSTHDDSSVTCLHGEESGPPGTGLSALVPNSSYTDDDVSTFSHFDVVNKLNSNL